MKIHIHLTEHKSSENKDLYRQGKVGVFWWKAHKHFNNYCHVYRKSTL